MRDKISQLFCLPKNACKHNSTDNRGQSVPNKATLNGGTTCTNGSIGPEGPEATETDSSGTGGMRKSLERKGSAPNDAVHLQRRVGLFSGVALIVGTMIGSGIFVSPSGLLARTGSVGVSFIIWLACGVLSLMGALAYAELGTMNTSSGAEWAYFMDAYGPAPAFLFSWVSTLVLKPSQMAIICLSFAQYAVEAFVSECDPPMSVVKMVALVAIVMILFVNCYSVNLGMAVQNVFTAAKLVAVLIVICGGAWKLIQGNTQHLANAFNGPTPNVGAVATAFYTGLWAYDGWNNLNYVTEEIKNPSKNLPRSIVIGIPLVTLCYALINISYLAAMSPTEMVQSEAVAVTFGNRILGVMAWLMPLSVTVSTFGSANGTLFAAGRLCFAASREGHLLDILSYVHVRRLTPAPGLIFHSLIAAAMVLYGTIDSLIDFFSFTAWIFYGGSMLALIVMRFTKPNYPRPYKVPIIIPVVVLVISMYLVVAPIIDSPRIEYLYALLFIFAGLIFYIPFVKLGMTPRFMNKVTLFLQLLLEVVPTSSMALFD
ncbi:b(0,+)-type amino acid transporter 1 isoform X1 [Stomoxys calcitrans]|uniref:b(0,+)-type amino acid transporter 1 n=1 Tax=Stomoxys calcitrans TaxID=35570 RepID=A0A1I8P8H0_STOCA|nr:b(0,+)-type amino acid transporter 1 isoform X1 [Stomoxys calcitrans]